MKTFNVTHKLKQAVYAYVVTHLLKKEEKIIHAQAFKAINTKQNGRISKQEFFKAYEKYFGNDFEFEKIDKVFD